MIQTILFEFSWIPHSHVLSCLLVKKMFLNSEKLQKAQKLVHKCAEPLSVF